MQTIALITARGGSKGLPGKNIRLLGGKPMIAYSIEAALACPLIDAVYVSTDDVDIAHVAEVAGATIPFIRPAELATDSASSQDVVVHFMNWFEEEHAYQPQTLVLLQPTSPLRTAHHLTDAMMLYHEKGIYSSVVSVTDTKPIAWQAAVSGEGALVFHQAVDMSHNRQALAVNVVLNGALYITEWSRAKTGQYLEAPVYGYAMDTRDAVDIDTLADFELAEYFLSKQTQLLEVSL